MNCEISLFLKQMDWSGRVLNVISNDIENFLWNKMYDVYKFKPGTDYQCEWIQIPCESKVYYKDTPWTAEQEHIITSLLIRNGNMGCSVILGNMKLL